MVDEIVQSPILGTARSERLMGTHGDDEIYGRAGRDVIFGKKGDDLLDPGLPGRKPDVLKGGPGRDTFVVRANSMVMINDFNVNNDRLDLSGLKSWQWYKTRSKSYIFDEEGFVLATFKRAPDLAAALLL